jgi:hypothetical protein
MMNYRGWPLSSVVSAGSLAVLCGRTGGTSSNGGTRIMGAQVWVLRSERDNNLLMTGNPFDRWTTDPDQALQFNAYSDAEKYRDNWTKEVKPHWPVLVRRFVK